MQESLNRKRAEKNSFQNGSSARLKNTYKNHCDISHKIKIIDCGIECDRV